MDGKKQQKKRKKKRMKQNYNEEKPWQNYKHDLSKKPKERPTKQCTRILKAL